MSTFDPRLLEETIIDEANVTFIEPAPEGEHNGLVDDFKIRSVSTDRGDVPVMDVYWMIPDEKIKKALGRDRVIAKQSVWIDLNEDGSIGVGPSQNAQLGRLREALGLNGKGFTFSQLRGAGPARILVTHRKADTGDVYAEVKKVVPAQ